VHGIGYSVDLDVLLGLGRGGGGGGGPLLAGFRFFYYNK